VTLNQESRSPQNARQKQSARSHLRKPEPEPLENVPGDLLRPLSILGIQSGLARRDIRISWIVPRSPLKDLPEPVQREEDGDADVGREEVWVESVLIGVRGSRRSTYRSRPSASGARR